ncbi:MAG: primosomal protein N' [Bacteroidia bacterium]|nr:primosomal protein N' [Bacteroidia bacterium]
MLELNTDTNHHERETLFAEVILPLALPKTFTYRIPFEMNNDVKQGMRVTVQFGKKKLYSAIVHSVHSKAPEGYEAKFLHAIIDEHPVVNARQLQLWEWMASYYMCSLGEVMNAALPAGLKLESESKVFLNRETEIDYGSLNDKQYLIVEALEKNNELTISQIAEIVQQKQVHHLLKDLLSANLILIHEELKNAYKPKTIACVKMGKHYTGEEALKELFDKLEKKAPKQLDLVMAFVQMSFNKSRITKKELLEQSRSSDAIFKALCEKEIFEIYTLKEDEFLIPAAMNIQFDLNEEQESALVKTKHLFAEKNVVLLHGITGSGKTHVYVKLIEEELNKGKQVLYLLPEIALTSQVIMRLRRYFGNHIVTFHSRLSDRERIDNWQRIASGKAQLVLGPRSSMFLPYKNLGLVIVDEEHENSFKQQDPAPRYHARDTAIYLASIWKAPVLLGSATPSYETYFNANTGKYGLVELMKRFSELDLPEMVLADVSHDKKKKTMRAMFGELLLNELEQCMQTGEQAILFQNRRGYAPMLECAICSWVPKCVNCDIHLTYHKLSHKVHCHFCGYSETPPVKCKQCGSSQMSMVGFGTERVEDELNMLIPTARLLRLDLDATRTKNSHTDILHDFEQHKADVLIGTQMISKGLDFAKVNLVGIVNADSLLNFPDFRANEKAFQLIEQVAGRAGRTHRKGKVIIQTSNPMHRVLQLLVNHDYFRLYTIEMHDREQFHYPPYYRLIRLTLRHKEEKLVKQGAEELAKLLRAQMGKRIIGPESPYVGKIKNKYLQQFLIKFEKGNTSPAKVKQLIHEVIEQWHQSDKLFRSIDLIPDVDPY